MGARGYRTDKTTPGVPASQLAAIADAAASSSAEARELVRAGLPALAELGL